jgi:hypothetical protein
LPYTTNKEQTLNFHPEKIRLCTPPVLPPPLANVAAASQVSPSKVLFAMKSQSAITRPQASAAITFSATIFSMKIKKPTCPMMATDSKASCHSLLKPHDQIEGYHGDQLQLFGKYKADIDLCATYHPGHDDSSTSPASFFLVKQVISS